MAVYTYEGLFDSGKKTRGIIDADTPKLARVKLRKMGVFPTDLTLERTQTLEAASREGFLARRITRRVPPKDVAIMVRQIATLVGAGMPLVSALTAMIEQVETHALKKVLTQVRERVNEGASFAEALRDHPKVFEELFVNMVGAGEQSGALDIVLDRLADYLEERMKMRNKVWATLTYPILMACVCAIVLFVIFTQVVPRLTDIFTTIGKALPLPTVVMIALGDFFQKSWPLLLLAMVVLAIFGRLYVRTPRGRKIADALSLRTPLFGKLTRKIAVSRFSRTLSTLLASGIPLVRSLDIVATVVNNVILAQAIRDARASITEGASIAGPLRASGVFPPILIHMVSVGEQSGELEGMLLKVADAYDNEVETTIQALTALMEPMMILFMAAIVVFIAVSILLPILQMNQLAGA